MYFDLMGIVTCRGAITARNIAILYSNRIYCTKVIKCNCTKTSAFQLQIKHALGGSKQIIVLAPLEKFIIYSWHENDTPRPHFSNLKNKGFPKKSKAL